MMSDMTGRSANDLIRNLTRQGLGGGGAEALDEAEQPRVQEAIEEMEKVKRARRSIDAFLHEYPKADPDMSDGGIIAYTMMTAALGASTGTSQSTIEKWEQSAQEILNHRELFLAMKDYGLLVGAASTLYEEEKEIPEIRDWLAHLWIKDYPLGGRWAAIYDQESLNHIWESRTAAVSFWGWNGHLQDRNWEGLLGRKEMRALIISAGRGEGWRLV